MSTQLDTMMMEQGALETELQHLKDAEDINSAAEKILLFFQGKTDVFTVPPAPDNEWFTTSQPKGGCCNIM